MEAVLDLQDEREYRRINSASYYNLDERYEMDSKIYGFKYTPKLTKPKTWFCKIAGHKYTELWLRIYAQYRHNFSCWACCSDYANHRAEIKMPIVRNREMDLKLLYQHALLIRGETRTKGQK